MVFITAEELAATIVDAMCDDTGGNAYIARLPAVDREGDSVTQFTVIDGRFRMEQVAERVLERLPIPRAR